jgi:hypothetical protein
MPKSLNDNQRSFKVANASTVDDVDFGRYIGVKPSDVVRKALREVFAKSPKTAKQVYFSLRETTRYLDKERIIHYYVGTRNKVNRKVKVGGKVIEVKYEYAWKEIQEDEYLQHKKL